MSEMSCRWCQQSWVDSLNSRGTDPPSRIQVLFSCSSRSSRLEGQCFRSSIPQVLRQASMKWLMCVQLLHLWCKTRFEVLRLKQPVGLLRLENIQARLYCQSAFHTQICIKAKCWLVTQLNVSVRSSLMHVVHAACSVLFYLFLSHALRTAELKAFQHTCAHEEKFSKSRPTFRNAQPRLQVSERTRQFVGGGLEIPPAAVLCDANGHVTCDLDYSFQS